MGGFDMPKAKRKTDQNHLKKTAPMVGVVGASVALVGGAYATGVAEKTPDVSAGNTTLGPQINLSEEELSDVNLGTFYVFDKEGLNKPGQQYAQRCRCGWRCRACGGCGCRACRACGGCSGCSCGCCISWGACYWLC
jgi:hypothetical protein